MKVSVLGCSGGIGAGHRTTSILLDDAILLDAGTGVGDLSLDRLERIRHVFVTHSHLDHVCGIPLLVDTIFDVLDTPLTIHGQPETLRALQQHIFNDVIWPDFARIPNADKPVLVYREMLPGERRTVENCTLELIPVTHTIPAAGYRIECQGGAFAYSGDTSTTDRFWEILNTYPALDLLFVESAFSNQDLALSRLARHYCPSLLAEDLRKLKHRPRVYISHLKPGAEEEIMEECQAAIDGLDIRRLNGGEIFEL